MIKHDIILKKKKVYKSKNHLICMKKALPILFLFSLLLGMQFIYAQDASWQYNESELAQAHLGNIIFIAFVIIAALIILVVYFLNMRHRQKEIPENKKRVN
jgi:hypothetical protein